MLRVMFNLAAITSFVLLLVSLALWLRGQFTHDYISYNDSWNGLSVENGPGAMTWNRTASMVSELPDSEFVWRWEYTEGGFLHYFEFDGAEAEFSMLGVELYTGVEGLSYRAPSRYQTLIVPHWLTALLAGVLPAWGLLATRGRRERLRRAAGQCVKCAYDLCGSPEGAACPECGAVRV